MKQKFYSSEFLTLIKTGTVRVTIQASLVVLFSARRSDFLPG